MIKQSTSAAASTTAALPVITRISHDTIVSIVPSDSEPGEFRTVRLDLNTGKGRCSCPASVECYHIKALREVAAEQGLMHVKRHTAQTLHARSRDLTDDDIEALNAATDEDWIRYCRTPVAVERQVDVDRFEIDHYEFPADEELEADLAACGFFREGN